MSTSSAADLELIRLMADGGFHSGQEMGVVLGMSRAAVWKRLQKLSGLGLDIESVKGKGYRLPGGIDLLSANDIRAGLDHRVDIDVIASTTSTSDDLLGQVDGASRTPRVLLAEYQSGARGRRGKSWLSPFGKSISMSVAWTFPWGASRLEGLSLAVGVAVCRTLASLGVKGVGLKWPNDVLVDGRKLAGILIEVAGDMDVSCKAIVGIGINYTLPQAAFEQIDQPCTGLGMHGLPCPPRNLLARTLIDHVLDSLQLFSSRGFAAFREQWCEFDCCAQQPVELRIGERRIKGVASGVTDQGAIIILRDGVRETYVGGEISLRRL